MNYSYRFCFKWGKLLVSFCNTIRIWIRKARLGHSCICVHSHELAYLVLIHLSAMLELDYGLVFIP